MLEEGKRKGSAMNIDIAQRLYELRREHGYSQESLAEALDISRQAISKWERAESAPDMGNLIALADLYGITIDELVRPGNNETSECIASNPVSAAEENRQSAEEAEPPKTPASSEDSKTVHAHGHGYAKPEGSERLQCGLRRFPYPLLILVIVLICCLLFGMWESLWLFLSIPFFYWIARIVERDPLYIAAHTGTASDAEAIPNAPHEEEEAQS